MNVNDLEVLPSTMGTTVRQTVYVNRHTSGKLQLQKFVQWRVQRHRREITGLLSDLCAEKATSDGCNRNLVEEWGKVWF
jgi:hypothetical protein